MVYIKYLLVLLKLNLFFINKYKESSDNLFNLRSEYSEYADYEIQIRKKIKLDK